jgi:tRNA nucleotidyltransferase/poly(A) polymerase
MKIYLCGGAVRDKLLGRSVSDRDYVVVGATPQKMLDLGFTQVGADFPVFLHPETGEEYALARTERKTGDGYLGFKVDANPKVTLTDDLARRDLTINSMAMDDNGAVFDPHGGLRDLENKVLRHTSKAFEEDPLRVVRLARFAARFDGFSIDETTMLLAARMVRNGDLNHLPYERFAAEITKVLDTCTPDQARVFFAVLSAFDVSKHVHFFNSVTCAKMGLAAQMAINDFSVGDRLVAFAALARGNATFSTAVGGAEGWLQNQLLSQNCSAMNDAHKVEALMSMLRRIGWQNRMRMVMAAKVADAARDLDWVVAYGRSTLVDAFNLAEQAAKVGATLANEGLSGKEIGQAVDAARREALQKLM